MSDHPIGMDYADTARRKSKQYLYPQRDEQRTRLFNGRLGCGSCHSLYAQQDNHLIDSNVNGELCTKCHSF